MKRKVLFIVIILFMSIHTASAVDIEVNANQSAAEGKVVVTRRNLSLGLDMLYSADKYTIGSGILSFENDELIDKLKFAIGFKGLMGPIRRTSEDADLKAAGFLGSLIYDLSEIDLFYYNMPFDLEFSAELCYAPAPLCMGDSDGYTEIKTGLGIHILEKKKGTLMMGFRSLETRFDESLNNWRMSDNALFFGYKFSF